MLPTVLLECIRALAQAGVLVAVAYQFNVAPDNDEAVKATNGLF